MASTTNTLAQHYDVLEPDERLTALLEAVSRRDFQEAGRLRGACPRRTYTAPDRDFADRLSLVNEAATVVAIDLRGYWGQLRALRWMRTMTLQHQPLHQMRHQLSFLHGVRTGHGLNVSKNAKAGTDVHFFAANPIWAAELPVVDERADQSAQDLLLVLDLAIDDTAAELAVVWKAFSRFCQSGPGLDAPTVLAARGLASLAKEVTVMLGHYPHLLPDPLKMAEYQMLIGTPWNDRFGYETEQEAAV